MGFLQLGLRSHVRHGRCSIVITYVNLTISVVTLAILFWYALLTRGIEKEAIKQTEGLSKPAVTIRCSIPPPSDEAILNGETKAHIPGVYVELINIGNGPAMQLECMITHKRSEKMPPYTHKVEIPYLDANQSFAIPLTRTGLTPNHHCFIDCSYASLSGNKHRAAIELDGDKIKSLEFT